MLQLRSMLNVADNTGAKEVSLIGIPGCGNRKYAHIGDVVRVVVKKADPYAQVKKGDKLFAVIIRTRRPKKRKDGKEKGWQLYSF